MRPNPFKTTAVLSGALLLSFTSGFSALAREANLVPNGSFEELSGAEILYWPNNLSLENRTEERARSGDASLLLNETGRSIYSNVQGMPDLEGGETYTIRFWVDAREVTGAPNRFVSLRFVDLTNNEIHTVGFENAWSYPRRTSDWILIEKTLTIPENFVSGRLDLIWEMEEGDSAFVDDISMSRVGTYGKAEEMLVLADTEEVAADGRGLAFIEARIADGAGNPVLDAEGEVEFSISGPSRIVGPSTSKVVDGKAFVHLKGAGPVGSLSTVTATHPDFKGSVVIRTIRPSRAPTEEQFAYGMFEDGNLVFNGWSFEEVLEEIRDASEMINWVMLTNGGTDRTTGLFDIAEEYDINLFVYPTRDVFHNFFAVDSIDHTVEDAIEAARPVVEDWGDKKMNRGYYTIDEPTWDRMGQTAALNKAFHRLDPDLPAAPVLSNGARTPHMFDGVQPDILVITAYPVRGNTTVGSWVPGFAEHIREQARTLPAGYPLWTILQTHGSANPGNTGAAARTPEPVEVRAMHWLSLGEGTKGIFWFIFKTQQWWTGIEDNQPVFDEIANLADRMENYAGILPKLTKVEDRFEVEGEGPDPYVSTLTDAKGSYYVILQNGDCLNEQDLTVTSKRTGNRGGLRNLETGEEIRLGESVTLRPGDGAIYQYDWRI